MRASSNNPLRIVLLGPPGAGKGTQSELLCARLHIPHISTGELLREAQHAGTRLGRIATACIDKGGLIPDEVITGVVEDRLNSARTHTGFALDGFPRTVAQADGLELILHHLGVQLTAVLYYDTPEDVLIQRLAGRWTCEGCGHIYNFDEPQSGSSKPCDICGGKLYRRADDNPEAIRTRFKVYHECTQPLVEYYASRRLLHTIAAIGQVEEIYLRSLQTLGISN
ncbi:MAG: adenylate kinase [Armatimonadota bacterium]|nr:adenylate kinase [Armatimonadota bacterium]